MKYFSVIVALSAPAIIKSSLVQKNIKINEVEQEGELLRDPSENVVHEVSVLAEEVAKVSFSQGPEVSEDLDAITEIEHSEFPSALEDDVVIQEEESLQNSNEPSVGPKENQQVPVLDPESGAASTLNEVPKPEVIEEVGSVPVAATSYWRAFGWLNRGNPVEKQDPSSGRKAGLFSGWFGWSSVPYASTQIPDSPVLTEDSSENANEKITVGEDQTQAEESQSQSEKPLSEVESQLEQSFDQEDQSHIQLDEAQSSVEDLQTESNGSQSK